MDAEKIIYDRFFKPFEEKSIKNVGAELEFPLVNMSGSDVDTSFAKGVLNVFLDKGFKVDIAENGEALFLINELGDGVSFDNSYNNFEFSMGYGDNLCNIADRFYKYFNIADSYFKSKNHQLLNRGTNPNKKSITQNHVNFSTYNMVDMFLRKYPGKHKMSDFPAYLSSVQTHLDIDLKNLPKAYTFFAKLDFVRAILFSNSPDFDNKGYLCYRDYLWENSGFGVCENITGKIDEEFSDIKSLLKYFEKKQMFNRIRNGKYEIFEPVNICDYFENPKYGAQKEDIECYLSFKNVEITARGTLEIRSDCTQKKGEEFAPCAFNLGILSNLNEAAECTEDFFYENNITMTNTELRNLVVSGKKLSKICDEDFLSAFLYDLVEIAQEGLEKRRKGEEKFLKPLYKRAATLKCPAAEQ